MAVIDKALEFSDAQVLSIGSGASVKSSVVADLTGAGGLKNCWGTAITPDIGEAGNLEVNIQVNTTLTGTGTFSVALMSKAADASISSGGTTHHTWTLGVTPAAKTRYSIKVPAGTVNRFVGLLYSSASGTVTGGAMDAWMNLDHEKVD